MRVVVTGANGQLGMEVVRVLASTGHEADRGAARRKSAETIAGAAPERVIHCGGVDRRRRLRGRSRTGDARQRRRAPASWSRRPSVSARTSSTCRPTTSSTASSRTPYVESDAAEPAECLRALEARGRARARPTRRGRAHVVGVRCGGQEHHRRRGAAGRGHRAAALRHRPARHPDAGRGSRTDARARLRRRRAPASGTSRIRARSARTSSRARCVQRIGADPRSRRADRSRRSSAAPRRRPSNSVLDVGAPSPETSTSPTGARRRPSPRSSQPA